MKEAARPSPWIASLFNRDRETVGREQDATDPLERTPERQEGNDFG